jgi:hypothetical protein
LGRFINPFTLFSRTHAGSPKRTSLAPFPFFRPLFSVPFSFLNLRTAQLFNSASGKSESHKRTSLQQTLRLRERSEQENKALRGVTGMARILFI